MNLKRELKETIQRENPKLIAGEMNLKRELKDCVINCAVASWPIADESQKRIESEYYCHLSLAPLSDESQKRIESKIAIAVFPPTIAPRWISKENWKGYEIRERAGENFDESQKRIERI